MEMKDSNIVLLIIAVLLIVLYFTFRRVIDFNVMFWAYDALSLWGLYWQTEPEYCSPIKAGFTPVMPLEYYADFNKAIFPRIPSGDNTLNADEVKRICDRNLEWLQKNGKLCTTPTKIDIIYANSPDFNANVIAHVKDEVPFVIRGLDLTCFTTMRYDKLMEKIGENKVYMGPSEDPDSIKTCPEHDFIKFKNIVDKKCYVANITNVFYSHPDLLSDSDMNIIKDAMDGYMNNDSKQLFVSVTKGSGTPLHAAYTNNFYIMIQGEKTWSFYNPNQVALLYPNFQKTGVYMGSETRFLHPDAYKNREIDINKFPLIKYAERYEIELKEKDILYNPMSWFHSVYNKTAVSVACSTRWSKPHFIPDIHMLRYGNLTNPYLRNYVKDIYVDTGILGISHIDEHKHMLGEKDPDAIPLWDKYTNNGFKLCRTDDCSVHWHKS